MYLTETIMETVTTVINTSSIEQPSQHTSQIDETNPSAAAVLGTFVGLFIVILAVVIIGWVWTCLTMKKSEIQLSTQSQVSNTCINLADYYEMP